MRELKPEDKNKIIGVMDVAPSRVRELKRGEKLLYADGSLVAPSRVRELKPVLSVSLLPGKKSHLHGCVN